MDSMKNCESSKRKEKSIRFDFSGSLTSGIPKPDERVDPKRRKRDHSEKALRQKSIPSDTTGSTPDREWSEKHKSRGPVSESNRGHHLHRLDSSTSSKTSLQMTQPDPIEKKKPGYSIIEGEERLARLAVRDKSVEKKNKEKLLLIRMEQHKLIMSERERIKRKELREEEQIRREKKEREEASNKLFERVTSRPRQTEEERKSKELKIMREKEGLERHCQQRDIREAKHRRAMGLPAPNNFMLPAEKIFTKHTQ